MPESLPEENAEDVYDSAPCGYLILRADGTIVRVNQTFLRWTGYRRQQLQGRRVHEVYSAGSRIFHETHLAPLLHMQGEVREIAAEFRKADGTRLDAFVNASLHAGAAEGQALVRMTVFEARDRRTYERELLAERRIAERTATRLRLLQDMVVRCAAIERAEEIVAAVVRVGVDAFAATTTRVWLIAPAEGALRPLHGPPHDRAEPVGAHDAGTGRGTSELISLDDQAPEARATALLDVVRHAEDDGGLRMVTPLVTDQRVLGVVSFGFAPDRPQEAGPARPRVFGADEIELMRTVGRQAGQALDRVRLLEETTRQARQSGFLARLSRDLDETVGFTARAGRLVELLVPDVAGYAQVDLEPAADPHGGAGWQAAAPARPGGGWTLPNDVLAAVHAAGRAGTLVAVPLTTTNGARALVLPLRARNAVLGTLLLAGDGMAAAGHVGPEFLADLADRAGLSLDNARLAERDREVAHTLQRSLLAGQWPADPRYRVATAYRPAVHTLEVGGDWYDIFATSAESVGIVVGDVVGRGLGAASAMGQLRSAVRAFATAHGGPADVLRHMDEFVSQFAAGQMATLAYADLALDSGELRYACAGHPPPVLVDPGGETSFLWGARSGPLGAATACRERGEARLTLSRGSRLVLYTDGLFERRGERLHQSLERLAAAVAAHSRAPLDGLAAQLTDAMVPGGGGHDDMCLLALDYADVPQLRAEVVARMESLSGFRADLDAWLGAQGVGDYDRFGVVLATAEAVANAIEHGYDVDGARSVHVLAYVDGGTVVVRVSDTGHWRPPRAALQRGRGLALIGRLMDELMIDRGAGGTTVLMRRRTGDGRR
ncbi:SpoIIE family protein phosphatase [Dactylosporangium aurantiacum]|uniref:SpoIIE family protein phosphatase n=1 Tax=Dactylosporangium aurantiacum TaxID=35754 RepID=A0A9Q9IKR3_9ACTN|nr:SpoIIE family protein phosphatase [Dactylosporangium aurantiacum]MDG6105861.1 SpoIIE family protein phosphatase [Dactylosporangium aurantiacum]UWZ57962.1 SpoIIE family protein phosphatase [Dactylosporangium aurantiacum]